MTNSMDEVLVDDLTWSSSLDSKSLLAPVQLGNFTLTDLIPDDASSDATATTTSSTMPLSEEVMDSFIADEPGSRSEMDQQYVDPIFML